MSDSTPEKPFLAIKNWDVYQCRDRKGRNIKRYIKDYCDKDGGDAEYSKLTAFQRYIFDAVCRLRGRLGRNPEADATWIARALCVISTERPCVPHAISTLVARGFLSLTNQRVSSPDSDSDSDTDTDTDTKCLSAGGSKSQMENKQEQDIDGAVSQVWGYYLAQLEKLPALYTLTPSRRQMGVDRFAESLRKTGDHERAIAMMKFAVDGLRDSPWHNGKNDAKTPFNEWEHVFGATEKFEMFVGKANQ